MWSVVWKSIISRSVWNSTKRIPDFHAGNRLSTTKWNRKISKPHRKQRTINFQRPWMLKPTWWRYLHLHKWILASLLLFKWHRKKDNPKKISSTAGHKFSLYCGITKCQSSISSSCYFRTYYKSRAFNKPGQQLCESYWYWFPC